MMIPVRNGNVPASTPALDQPMPLSRLWTTTATPKLPVSTAVASSRARREIMGRSGEAAGAYLVLVLRSALRRASRRTAPGDIESAAILRDARLRRASQDEDKGRGRLRDQRSFPPHLTSQP